MFAFKAVKGDSRLIQYLTIMLPIKVGNQYKKITDRERSRGQKLDINNPEQHYLHDQLMNSIKWLNNICLSCLHNKRSRCGCFTTCFLIQVAVTNQLSFNSLTKMVVFTPFFLIINEAPFSIQYQELHRSGDPWTEVGQ